VWNAQGRRRRRRKNGGRGGGGGGGGGGRAAARTRTGSVCSPGSCGYRKAARVHTPAAQATSPRTKRPATPADLSDARRQTVLSLRRRGRLRSPRRPAQRLRGWSRCAWCWWETPCDLNPEISAVVLCLSRACLSEVSWFLMKTQVHFLRSHQSWVASVSSHASSIGTVRPGMYSRRPTQRPVSFATRW
jgi:hypothetical protein